MERSVRTTNLRETSSLRVATLLGCVALLASSSCGTGGGQNGSSQAGLVGLELPKSDGSTYFVDFHQNGRAERMLLQEVTWGRLVDVHDVDATGVTSPQPIFRDLVVRETILSDATNYRLERNAVTGQTRLVVRRTRGEPDDGTGSFETLLREAREPLPAVQTRGLESGPIVPHSVVPRNACLVLQFDDLLADGLEEERLLEQMVQLASGYPPETPHSARLLFDANHGGVGSGDFHTTRILIDLAVSEAEASTMRFPVPVNPIGLDASRPGATQANVALRLPVEENAAQGQFSILRNLRGSPLASVDNGPMETIPVRALVRGMRSGNFGDNNNGFLIDSDPPRVVADWPVLVVDASDSATAPGFEFDVDLQFLSTCSDRPRSGDIVVVGTDFFEVLGAPQGVDQDGLTTDVRVRALSPVPLGRHDALGLGSFSTPFEADSRVEEGCWVTFTPPPKVYPTSGISPFSEISIRFSEPMDPTTFSATDGLQIVRGPLAVPADGLNLVVGEALSSPDLRSMRYVPRLPFAHLGERALFHVEVVSGDTEDTRGGLTDLAGNTLRDQLPPIEFDIDPESPRFVNAGITQRFSKIDELPAYQRADVRGNVFVDTVRGVLEPRPVSHRLYPVDSSNPVPSIMIAFPRGIQTPITPLGSKLQALWRYADLGWQVRDETKYDLDVIGLYWSPTSGAVLSDFYPEFEIRLAHGKETPDELRRGFGGARYPDSGLGSGAVAFDDNLLIDERSPQTTVHPRILGYRLDPGDLSASPSGALLMPWPMNRGTGVQRTFTWRDTSVLALGGLNGNGVPVTVEALPPLDIEQNAGSFAKAGKVPSVGLPLLMEFRCYPTASGLGLNPLNILLAINTSAQPNFRAFSTGGINTAGKLVTKNPDLEVFPTGGFNPLSSPPGRPTARQADNSLYMGALDTVTRVSRGHSMWVDTQFSSPSYSPPLLLPAKEDQPTGTQVMIDFRGATSLVADPEPSPFNSSGVDAYGNLRWGVETFHLGVASWTDDITRIDGARYFQMRYTFLGNVGSGVTAELTSVSVAFSQE